MRVALTLVRALPDPRMSDTKCPNTTEASEAETNLFVSISEPIKVGHDVSKQFAALDATSPFLLK